MCHISRLTPKRDTRRNTADPVEGAPVKLTKYQILHLDTVHPTPLTRNTN